MFDPFPNSLIATEETGVAHRRIMMTVQDPNDFGFQQFRSIPDFSLGIAALGWDPSNKDVGIGSANNDTSLETPSPNHTRQDTCLVLFLFSPFPDA